MMMMLYTLFLQRENIIITFNIAETKKEVSNNNRGLLPPVEKKDLLPSVGS